MVCSCAVVKRQCAYEGGVFVNASTVLVLPHVDGEAWFYPWPQLTSVDRFPPRLYRTRRKTDSRTVENQSRDSGDDRRRSSMRTRAARKSRMPFELRDRAARPARREQWASWDQAHASDGA